MSKTHPQDSKVTYTPMTGMFLRLFWMAFGVAAMLATAGGLWAASGEGTLGWSLLYWLAVALIVAARYVDIRYYDGQTVDLEPADLGHWRRHTAMLIPLAAALWAAAIWTGQ